jgi:hypothetical protein
MIGPSVFFAAFARQFPFNCKLCGLCASVVIVAFGERWIFRRRALRYGGQVRRRQGYGGQGRRDADSTF